MFSPPTVSALERAVATVVRDCLAVRPREDVLVVADPHTRALGEALAGACAEAGGDAVFTLMEPRETDGTEPPPPVAAALAAADVFIAPTSRSLSHTQARKRASEAGARGATMPGVTADMLARVMDVDFDLVRERSRTVAALLDESDDAHLTCPRGSDLRLDLSGREGIPDDGDLTAPHAFGNLPCGEGFVAPVTGQGALAASSLATVGLAADPAVLRVDDGRLVDASGPEGAQFIARLRAHGADGTNLAELGVGTNDRATLTGNVLEDEKILGTVHVAFGASAGIGGTVAVPIHLDCVVLEPTLHVGGTLVLDGGRYALA
jgi:leucyl aminopeptidase (aminopeptidase T)